MLFTFVQTHEDTVLLVLVNSVIEALRCQNSLSGSGSGDDKKMTMFMEDDLALSWIEGAQNGVRLDGPRQRTRPLGGRALASLLVSVALSRVDIVNRTSLNWE